MSRPERKIDVLGVAVDNLTMEEAVSAVVELRQEGGGVVNFLNAHCSNVASVNPDYLRALTASDYVFGDGSGVKVAASVAGTPIVDNVNGTDMAPVLARTLARRHLSLFLVGGRPGVAATAAGKLSCLAPGLIVAGTEHGFHDEAGWVSAIDRIRSARPDIVWVAMGVPAQELWIERWGEPLGPAVVMGVGGLLDFLSERIPRAPRLLRALGLEWTWRLWQEPGRMWRRYLVGNLVFLARVVRARLGRRVRTSRVDGREAPCRL